VNSQAHAALLADMRLALRSEFGACVLYGLLARRTSDAELAQVLTAFQQEEREQIARLRALMIELGGQAPSRSLRRALLARLMHAATFLGARRLALRSCYESECTVRVSYQRHAGYLAAVALRGPALTCEELALTKERHARILEAWVSR
jgi:glutaminase